MRLDAPESGIPPLYALYFSHIVNRMDSGTSRYNSVLDLGCGKDLKELRILDLLGIPLCVGIDVREKPNLTRGTSRLTESCCVGANLPFLVIQRDRELAVHYIRADIDEYHLPVADCSFDLVMINNTIEHLHRPREVVEECKRVLKVDGDLLILTPNQAQISNRLRLLIGRSIYYPIDYWLGEGEEHFYRNGRRYFAGHVREYTVSELERLLRLVGFEIDDVRFFSSVEVPESRKLPVFRKVKSVLLRLIERAVPRTRYMISIIARKSDVP